MPGSSTAPPTCTWRSDRCRTSTPRKSATATSSSATRQGKTQATRATSS
ncbi:hypothetical protein [Streptomyces sp. NPDC048565]